MRISVEKDDPGYGLHASLAAVLVDGMKMMDVITADEETRYVKHYVRKNGILQTTDGRDATDPSVGQDAEILTAELWDHDVEILFKPMAAALMRKPNFLQTAEWLHAAGKEQGNLEHISVQVGVHLEEMLEFFEQLQGLDIHHLHAIGTLVRLADDYKKGRRLFFIKDAVKVLDALCDAEVTGNGVAFLCGWDKMKADAKVLFANADKFQDGKPVLLEGGKIGKREGWTPPDLADCV